jgi:H+/Cl- antiporter ClcA
MNCALAGMLVGTALAAGVHWVVSNTRRSGTTDSGEVWLQALTLTLVGGLVGLFWGVAHLTIEEFNAADESHQDYDDSMGRTCPPGST